MVVGLSDGLGGRRYIPLPMGTHTLKTMVVYHNKNENAIHD